VSSPHHFDARHFFCVGARVHGSIQCAGSAASQPKGRNGPTLKPRQSASRSIDQRTFIRATSIARQGLSPNGAGMIMPTASRLHAIGPRGHASPCERDLFAVLIRAGNRCPEGHRRCLPVPPVRARLDADMPAKPSMTFGSPPAGRAVPAIPLEKRWPPCPAQTPPPRRMITYNRAAVFEGKRGFAEPFCPVGTSARDCLAKPRGIGHFSPSCFRGKPSGSRGTADRLPAVAKIMLGKLGPTGARKRVRHERD
jgi:hypothetical protein